MQKLSLAGLRIDVTGAVHPLENTTQADLAAARVAVGASAGILRTTPLKGPFDPNASPATRGIAIAKTLGPFQDASGQVFWTDILAPLPQPQVALFAAASPAQPLLTAPIKDSSNPNSLVIGPGSVWIAASAFDAAAPAGFVGLLVSGGTLTSPVPLTILSNRISLIPGQTVYWELQLNPPPNPPSTGATGVDLAQSVISLPATLKASLAGVLLTDLSVGAASLTAYGSPVSLSFTKPAQKYRADIAAIEIFAAAGVSSFTISSVKSSLWKPAGTAAISNTGWVLPITETTFDKLGVASGDGALSVSLKAGVTAAWPALQPALSSSASEIICAPGALYFSLIAGAAVAQTFALWDAVPKPASATLGSPKTTRFTYFSEPASEALLTSGSLSAYLDRPLRVDGTRFHFNFTSAQCAIYQSPSQRNLLLLGESNAAVIALPPPISLVLENALLHVEPASGFALLATLDASNRGVSGKLGVYFAANRLIPTLPDPYAVATLPDTLERFNVPPPQCDPTAPTYLGTPLPSGQVVIAVTTWTDPSHALLSFSLTGRISELLYDCLLLDVSSNADQLGAGAFTQSTSQIALSNLQWTALGSRVAVATLPEISWEPIRNEVPSSPSTFAPNDGNAAILYTPTQALVPVEPLVLLNSTLDAVGKGAGYLAQFTLPFGISATANTLSTPASQKGGLALVRPNFPNSLQGGYQVSLLPVGTPPTFPGTASVDLGTSASPNYGASVLSFTVGQIFNSEFESGPVAPLERYDLSGYGASVFSDWRNPSATGSEIIQARFDTFTGRTAYEVVQAQAYCAPFGARFVRTITIERLANASLVRYDSGWRAASDGLFQWPLIPPSSFQLGGLQGVVNIRNIRESGLEFVAGTPTWQPVLFNADVALNPKLSILQGGAAQGAKGATVIPTSNVPGYLMILPTQTNLAASDLWALLDKVGPVSWPLSATVGISQSKLNMKLSSASVQHIKSSADTTVASLNGTPNLPSQGSWSMARRATGGTAAPVALDPLIPVPLLQNSSDTSKWSLADPVDILNLNAQTVEYGLLQATGTQKLFFAQPLIHDAIAAITPQVPPHLADVGALLGALGAFPGLSAALQFQGAIPDFSVGGGAFTYHKEWDVPAGDPVSLIDFGGTVGVSLDYKFDNRFSDNGLPAASGQSTHVTIDISPTGWSLTMRKLTFLLISPLGDASDPILKLVGTLKAGSGFSPTLTDLDVVYGGTLAPVQSVFANLQQLARFLPGGVGANLDISFSDGQLSIRDSFGLPQLPLGIGFVEGVALDLGATLNLLPPKLSLSCGISSPDNPFHWLVSPLSGTGCVVVGFENALPAVTVQAGIGVGLDIDVGIAQGGASIVLGFQVSISGSKIQFLATLTGQASVDVLDGLASATITLTAGLGITPEPFPPRLPPISLSGVENYKPFDDIIFLATCSVGIHLTVGWLVHVDFDGSWQFSKKIDVPSVGQILPI